MATPKKISEYLQRSTRDIESVITCYLGDLYEALKSTDLSLDVESSISELGDIITDLECILGKVITLEEKANG
jgi:hypothetical protein